LVADAINAAAATNPGVKYAIVDLVQVQQM
jgi:hypothetical protein